MRAAMKGGESEHAFYDDLGVKFDEDLNWLTGGGSHESPWLPRGDFLLAAQENFDHFSSGNCTWKAYSIGHALAREMARDPDANLSQKTLAYAYEAFSLHFLSDAFSSGHIRTPRVEIRKYVEGPSTVGDLLASWMHDEDSRLGLNVTNRRGDQWVAFGDSCLFDPPSARHAELVLEAMQLSVDGVEGNEPWAALDIIPWPDTDPERRSITPMFAMNGTSLLRRDSLNEPWNPKMTSWWDGAGTVTELTFHYRKPVDMPNQTQEAPARAEWLVV